MQMREKVGKSRNTVFFQWFVAPEARKVGSLKRRVRSHLARWEMKSCTPLWCEVHFQVKMYKTHHCRTTFGSCDVEKVHAVVARSTVPSQNVQNTRGSDHFWKLRCRKSARRCGAKYILKSTCTKHTMLGPLLEVQMSKKCTPLWREAHFQIKSADGYRALLDVQMSFRVAGAGIVHLVKSEQIVRVLWHFQCTKHQVGTTFWKLRWRKVARRCGTKHISKSKCTKHQVRTTFWKLRWRKKVHAVVARSTFQSQNAQNTPGPDHFWKLRCRKSARRCGAKMREAHLQVKKLKAQHVPSTFGSCDVEKVHAVCDTEHKNTPFSEQFWKLRCRKSARRCGAKHISKSKCQKHQGFGPLLDVQMSFRLPSFLEMPQNPHDLLTFDKVHNPCAGHAKQHLNVQKCSVPVCTFDLEMCFAPQRRTLFEHLNFQKCPEAEAFCTFWLGNVLRATTACNFSSLIWPAGSAPAALASLLFDPPEPQIIGKTSRLSYLFAHLDLLSSGSSFFWDFLFLETFSFLIFFLLFSSLLFFDSYHLCISSVHIVGSLTSKLPSKFRSQTSDKYGQMKCRDGGQREEKD